MFKYAIVLFLGATSAQAQQSTTQIQQGTPSPSTINLIGSFKSYNDLGRNREMADPAGRRLKSKNEMGLGFKSNAGWGLYGQLVETAQIKGPSGQNTFAPGDASLTIYHPIYKNDWLTVSGALRGYVPMTDSSVTNKLFQSSYYLNASAKLKNNWEVFNSVVPRYFSQPKYKPTDTTFYGEHIATVSRKVSPWLRLGMGQYSQVEAHPGTSTGFVSSTYPYADVVVSNQLFFGPRIYFPVASNGSVYDAPKQVSLNEVQAEFYLQATL